MFVKATCENMVAVATPVTMSVNLAYQIVSS